MAITNYEFKARAANVDELERLLLRLEPRFAGEDRQIDTYFNVRTGRLKLREGNIENSLIHYDRADTAGTKESSILLYEHAPDPSLKAILVKTLGVKVVVDKRRRIYFIGNVKFHFDRLHGLGTFVEVEAIDREGTIGAEVLKEQCRKYAELFELKDSDYVPQSYSDLIMKLNQDA